MLSRVIIIGGRRVLSLDGVVNSFHSTSKIGHATSGSWAPSLASPARDNSGEMGISRECVFDKRSLERTGSLAAAICDSKVAVYVFWIYCVGIMFGAGA